MTQPTPSPPTPAPAPVLRVNTLWLVDTDTDQDVEAIACGSSYKVPSDYYGHYGLRADVSSDVQAVAWRLNSQYMKRDKEPPYSFGDELGGDYQTIDLEEDGYQEIWAIPFDKAHYGTFGPRCTIYLHRPDSPAPVAVPTPPPVPAPTLPPTHKPTPAPVAPAPVLQVNTLWLVDTDTDQDVEAIACGSSYKVPSKYYGHYGLRADVSSDVQAVAWRLNQQYVKRDSVAPYSFGYEFRGDYKTIELEEDGYQEIWAVPFDKVRYGTYGQRCTIWLHRPDAPP